MSGVKPDPTSMIFSPEKLIPVLLKLLDGPPVLIVFYQSRFVGSQLDVVYSISS
jgi:hypothetical protein